MEGTTQKDLQVLRELDFLTIAAECTSSRVEELESRLQKVVTNLPRPETEKEPPETQLCDIAEQMRNIKREVQKANAVMSHILDNLQL